MATNIAMKGAGINVARIGEFAWSRMEPKESNFHFEWLHRAVDALAVSEIATISGTPTATPPIWLSRKHPDIMKEEKGLQKTADLSLSKKLACGDLFRQILSEYFRASAKTPRPTGKAGRYEQKSEGLRPL